MACWPELRAFARVRGVRRWNSPGPRRYHTSKEGFMTSRSRVLFAGAVVVMIAGAVAVRHAWAEVIRRQVPRFEPDPLWSQALPNKWVTGQVGGVAVDSHDNLGVFHRPASIPEGERGASLTPPQSECCVPAPSVVEFAP